MSLIKRVIWYSKHCLSYICVFPHLASKLCGRVKFVPSKLPYFASSEFPFHFHCSLLFQFSKAFPWMRLSNSADLLIMAQSGVVGGVCIHGKWGAGIKSSHLDSAKKSSLGFDKQIMSFCVITLGPQISEEINQSQPCR